MAYVGSDTVSINVTPQGSKNGSQKSCPAKGKVTVKVTNLTGNNGFYFKVYLYDRDVSHDAYLGAAEFSFNTLGGSSSQSKTITLPANDDIGNIELIPKYLWNSEVSSSVKVEFNHTF
jgi:hypothetical protein